jgi:hypothetical protein
LDTASAAAVLQFLSADHYVWNGTAVGALGFKYLFVLPVHANRSVQTQGALYDAAGGWVMNFTARAHGVASGLDCADAPPWPAFSDDAGANQFVDCGDTPTGLYLVDLNSPEPNATEFGPYPINRLVQGVAGNAAWLVPNIRDGLLLHTGNWSEVGWAPPAPMPNSLGCIHSWPDEIEAVWQTLTQRMGVQVRPNTGGALPYPYAPQGLMAIQLVGGDGASGSDDDIARV